MTYYQRNLPHWQPATKDIFLTWRLHTAGERFRALDRALDLAQRGPLWLKDPRVAECVVAALQRGQGEHLFCLHAYVVMVNHVHVLLQPAVPVAQITRALKGATAREANQILGLGGSRFWQAESFDRWIRTSAEWSRVRAHIEQNPVKAGLVRKPEEWPWSSAAAQK